MLSLVGIIRSDDPVIIHNVVEVFATLFNLGELIVNNYVAVSINN